MTEVERNGLLTSEEAKKSVDEIISYFENERDEELGFISADEILEFFLQTIGPHIYNKGIEDARAAVQQGGEELDFALGVLRKE